MEKGIIAYLAKHRSGYLSELRKSVGEEAVEELELVGFIERGQSLIKKNDKWERVESYKTTKEFEEYLNIVNPKKEKRGFIQRLFDKDTARLISKNLKRAK